MTAVIVMDKLREQVVNTIENLEASHDTLRMDLRKSRRRRFAPRIEEEGMP